jgi:hypothetical protein
VRSREAQVLAKEMNQEQSRLNLSCVFDAIDFHVYLNF